MTQLYVRGEAYDLRSDGHLDDLSEWNESIAEALAERERILLTHEHWLIINLMRDFYARYNIAPVKKLLKRDIAAKYGQAIACDEYLSKLFPCDVVKQASMIAGLPQPQLDAELEPSSFIQSAPNPQDTSHFVDEFNFDGKTVKVYPNGNLVNLADWNEKLAAHLAEKENISLTDEHWEVINMLRSFYFDFGVTPMVNLLMKHLREKAGNEKSSREHLYKLFPGGPSRQGSRIAGLPEPQGCIDA